jgi:myo-inositol catabolism protein IolH
MKIALDLYMRRHLSLEELPRKVAELGYEYIELSPLDDLLAWWVAPRAYPERIQSFKKALKQNGVKIASLLPMYRWASPYEDERRTAVRHWKKAIEIEMGVDTMNSEFGRGPSPDRSHASNCCGGRYTAESSEAVWWRSMEELTAVFEREGIQLNIEPHPEDFVETLHPALGMIRVIGSKNVKFLYCAPHTFYFGADMAKMIGEAAPMLAHVHVADTYNHKASSGLRYICNPARRAGDRAPAHGHRPGRGRLGHVLLQPRRGRLRRDHDRVRVRLGGARRPIRALHARGDATLRRQVLGQTERVCDKLKAAACANPTPRGSRKRSRLEAEIHRLCS